MRLRQERLGPAWCSKSEAVSEPLPGVGASACLASPYSPPCLCPTSDFWDPDMFWGFTSSSFFFSVGSSPLCEHTLVCASIPLFVDIWVVSSCWLLWVQLLWMFMAKSVCTCAVISLGSVPRSTCSLPKCFPMWLYDFTLLPTSYGSSCGTITSPKFDGLFKKKLCGYSSGCEWSGLSWWPFPGDSVVLLSLCSLACVFFSQVSVLSLLQRFVGLFFVVVDFCEFFVYSGYKSFIKCMSCQYFNLVYSLAFHFLNY